MKIIIDIGSSTVKVYKVINFRAENIENHSIFFKDGFTKKLGLSSSAREELLTFLVKIKKDFPVAKIELYATSLFRKMSNQAQDVIEQEINQAIGYNLIILSHKLEGFYIQQALTHKFKKGRGLIINIGGGSTELILIEKQKALQTFELENLGVGTMIGNHPEINKVFSEISLADIADEVELILPSMDVSIDVAFVTGGELTYMKIAKYNLTKNTLFDDVQHPYMISSDDYRRRNEEIFFKKKLIELENLMPENPKWMQGARAYSGIAQAIVQKYAIKNIVPSDINLVDGIVVELEDK